MFKFKRKKAYYSVHALRDGTIWFASQTRKPRKTKHETPKIDEDGVHCWYLDEDEPNEYTDWAKAVRHGAVANCLNMRRVLREQVEPRIVEVLAELKATREQLERIEKALARAPWGKTD